MGGWLLILSLCQNGCGITMHVVQDKMACRIASQAWLGAIRKNPKVYASTTCAPIGSR